LSLITYPFTAEMALAAGEASDKSDLQSLKQLKSPNLEDAIVESTLSYISGIPHQIMLHPYPQFYRDFIISYIADSMDLSESISNLVVLKHPDSDQASNIARHITAVSNELTGSMPTFLSRHPTHPAAQYARAAAIIAVCMNSALAAMSAEEGSAHQAIFNQAVATSIIVCMMVCPPDTAAKFVHTLFTSSNLSATFSSLKMPSVVKLNALVAGFEIESTLQNIVEDSAQHCSWYASSAFNASADAIYNLYKS